jgi:hypothetical protein
MGNAAQPSHQKSVQDVVRRLQKDLDRQKDENEETREEL